MQYTPGKPSSTQRSTAVRLTLASLTRNVGVAFGVTGLSDAIRALRLELRYPLQRQHRSRPGPAIVGHSGAATRRPVVRPMTRDVQKEQQA
jgi:hypothetical protein